MKDMDCTNVKSLVSGYEDESHAFSRVSLLGSVFFAVFAMLCSSCSPSLQGQTVGLLTQRLADARSAIAAELQDAATERAPS